MNNLGYIAFLLCVSLMSVSTVFCGIIGYVVTAMASNWMLLIAEAILPVIAVVHGLGHVVGFWP